MGLDIRAFNGLKKCDVQSEDAYIKYPNCSYLNTDGDMFFNQSGGLNGYYSYDGEYIIFRAGSYSSYDKWRKGLAKMIGYDEIESVWDIVRRDVSIGEVLSESSNIDIPFIELLYFSDCEGVIGEKASKNLYSDFVNYRENAIKMHNNDWISLYDDFTRAFKIASSNGCVQFC